MRTLVLGVPVHAGCGKARCWQRQREATAGRCLTSSSVSHCCLQLHMKCFCNIPFLYSLIFPGCSRVGGAWKRLQTSSCQIFLRCDFSECEVGSVSPVAHCTASTACVAEYENDTRCVNVAELVVLSGRGNLQPPSSCSST